MDKLIFIVIRFGGYYIIYDRFWVCIKIFKFYFFIVILYKIIKNFVFYGLVFFLLWVCYMINYKF